MSHADSAAPVPASTERAVIRALDVPAAGLREAFLFFFRFFKIESRS